MSDEASKLKGLLWVSVALCLAMGIAVGLSPLIHALPWSWEVKMAEVMTSEPSGKLCLGGPDTDRLMKELISRLYPLTSEDSNFSIHVDIVRDPAVNAYATLGGHIYVNEGLLNKAESAEEVAGVLAHEIEHVSRRHILENIFFRLITVGGMRLVISDHPTPDTSWLPYFLTMTFTRGQESEADEGGLKRLQIAHINNQGFRDFFRRMENACYASRFLSDHPDNQDRYEMATRFENEAPTPIMTDAEWQRFKGYCH